MNSRILPVLALVIAIGVFFTYVSPVWSGPIAETKAAIASDEQTLQAAADYVAKQNQLAAARNAIDPDNLARLETFIPDSVDNVGLILDINALAARSGLSLSNIDIINASASSGAGAAAAPPDLSTSGASATRPSPVNSIDLTLAAIGTYKSLQDFLAGIEKSARLLDVQDITVKGSNSGVYTYQMVVRLYWLR